MPYADEVSLLILGGLPAYPVVTVRLWDIYSTVGPGGGWQEIEIDSTTFPSMATGRATFSFPVRGPGPTLPNRNIGLSMDIATSPVDGMIFRTGMMPTLPTPFPADPAGFIDLLLPDVTVFSAAGLASSLPAVPFTLTDGCTTITAISTPAIGPGTITISATGTTTCSPLVAPGEGFTYAVTLTMGPSTTVRDTSRIIEVGTVPGSDSLTFTNPGGWVTAIQTGILNAASAWISDAVTPAIRASVEAGINAAAIAGATSALGVASPPGTPPSLPPGTVLSVRRLVVGSVGGVTGVHVWPVLGSFGSLASKFPALAPAAGGSKGPCVLVLLAEASLPALSLAHFRRYRDEVMDMDPAGRRAVSLYYAHGPEVARILAGHPVLATRAARLAAKAQRRLGPGEVGGDLRRRARDLLWEIADHASGPLRTDIAWAVAAYSN